MLGINFLGIFTWKIDFLEISVKNEMNSFFIIFQLKRKVETSNYM